MAALKWVLLLATACTLAHGSPFHGFGTQPKKCSKVIINSASPKRKCFGLPDRLVCEERYKQVCEDIVKKDSRVECATKVVPDLDTEVCETELINKCHTTHTTVFEDKCTTTNKVECYIENVQGNGGNSNPTTAAESGEKKEGKKGKKGRSKRGLLQAVLLQNALNQRHPIRVSTTPAPAQTQRVCYNIPTTTCKKVGKDKPETHCEEVEGEKLCARTPKYREIQECKTVGFDIPQVSCRHMPWKVCEHAPNIECHSSRVINKGVGYRKVCG